jgi:hypothetical protein
MPMPLTDDYFELFQSSPAPAPQASRKREPLRPMRPSKEDPMELKNLKAHRVWMQSLVAYAVTGLVGLCLFLVVQSGAQYHTALVENQRLGDRLKLAQQNNISYKAALDRKFSLEVIHNTALRDYHMVPVEAGRVKYLNISHGDQRLD